MGTSRSQLAEVAPGTPSVSALEREALALAPQLFRLALRLVGSRAEAEDVVQDAFVKAITALRAGTFQGTSTLSTWLFRIVTNTAVDRLRIKKPTDLRDEHAPVVDGSAEHRVALRELSDALADLPDDQRVALVLKELQGLSAREVAEVMERSEGSVEQLLVRARQALKRRFEP